MIFHETVNQNQATADIYWWTLNNMSVGALTLHAVEKLHIIYSPHITHNLYALFLHIHGSSISSVPRQ